MEIERAAHQKKSWSSTLLEDFFRTSSIALLCGFIGLAFVGETPVEGIEAFRNNFASVYTLRAIDALVWIVLEVEED